MNIGIDHGYYAIKTRHFSFPAGISEYSHEPYTLQNTLEYGGKFFVCGTGRQPILRNKMENDNYYLLTLAAIAREIKQRGEKAECSVNLAAGLPLAGFGREKKPFRDYQYQQAMLYINNEENLNLTEFNDDFIRRIIEQVTVLSATQIRIRFVGGYEQDANLPLKK